MPPSMNFHAISTYTGPACFPLPRIFQSTQICECEFSFGYKFLNGFCAAQVGAGMNNDFVAAVSVPGVGCMCVRRVGLPTFVNMNAGRGPFEILTAKAPQQLLTAYCIGIDMGICGNKYVWLNFWICSFEMDKAFFLYLFSCLTCA